MKRSSTRRSLYLAALALALAVRAQAASSYGVLHSFDPTIFNVHPPLVQGSDGALYGTASGGSNAYFVDDSPPVPYAGDGGIVFKINPDGTGLFVLHEFDGYWNVRLYQKPHVLHPDSYATPMSLISAGGVLYGTALQDYGWGLLFRVNEDGTGFEVIHRFTGVDGRAPFARLTSSGGVLYGTTAYTPTIFRVAVDGSDFRTLNTGHGSTYPLVDIDGVLYGADGSYGYSSLYKLNEDGSGFAALYTFDFPTTPGEIIGIDGVLYGMAVDSEGYPYSWQTGQTDTVYKINLDGSGYTKLLDLPDSSGAFLLPGLTYSGGALYGINYGDTAAGGGYVYKVNPDGSGFTIVYQPPSLRPYGTPTVAGGFVFGASIPDTVTFNSSFFRVGVDGTGYAPFPVGTFLSVPVYPPVLSGVPLISHKGTFYGLNGTQVFAIENDGGGFRILRDFPQGDLPRSLTRVGPVLYGTTPYPATVFSINTDGTGFRTVSKVGGPDLYSTGLLAVNGVLYGTVATPYTSPRNSYIDDARIYTLKVDGSGLRVLHEFSRLEGVGVVGSLVYVNGVLFGIATHGGPNNAGTLFSIGADGSNFTVLHSFGAMTPTGPDGAQPVAGLVSSGTMLYGVTEAGGNAGAGTAFRFETAGYMRGQLERYQKLHDFGGAGGKQPESSLLVRDGLLYGTTAAGGSNKSGVAFEMATDGSSFRKLFDFGGKNGKRPLAGLTFGSDGALYGTTRTLGPVGGGVVFRLVP